MGWYRTHLLHQVTSEVTRVERGSNQHFCIFDVLLELAVGALLIICDLQRDRDPPWGDL